MRNELHADSLGNVNILCGSAEGHAPQKVRTFYFGKTLSNNKRICRPKELQSYDYVHFDTFKYSRSTYWWGRTCKNAKLNRIKSYPESGERYSVAAMIYEGQGYRIYFSYKFNDTFEGVNTKEKDT